MVGEEERERCHFGIDEDDQRFRHLARSLSFPFSASSLLSLSLSLSASSAKTHLSLQTHSTPAQSDPPSRINSLCFHRSHPLLFAASDEDDSLQVIDSSTGDLRATVPCPRYGVSLVVATHAPTAVLHASSNNSSLLEEKENGAGGGERAPAAAAPPTHERLLDLHAARYLDLHSNAYLRYFKGHAAPLCALSLSPQDDTFVSAAVDGTVRFWDLRAPTATGALDLPPTRRMGGGSGGGGGRFSTSPPSLLLPQAAPAVAHEEQGMVLAISSGARAPLRLFDSRAIGRGPFATLPVAAELPPLAAARPATVFAPAAAAAAASAVAAAGGGPTAAKAATTTALLSPDPDRLVFSPDGGAIAVAGGGGLLVLDSFKGSVIARLLPGAPPPPPPLPKPDEGAREVALPPPGSSSSSALTPAWSPCGRYVVSGCSDGAIRAWKVRGRGGGSGNANGGGAAGGGGRQQNQAAAGPVTPAPSATWFGHAEAPGALAWAPRTHMVASGDNSALALWVPGPGSFSEEKDEKGEKEEK